MTLGTVVLLQQDTLTHWAPVPQLSCHCACVRLTACSFAYVSNVHSKPHVCALRVQEFVSVCVGSPTPESVCTLGPDLHRHAPMLSRVQAGPGGWKGGPWSPLQRWAGTAEGGGALAGSGPPVLVSGEAAAGRAACVSLERPSIARG